MADSPPSSSWTAAPGGGTGRRTVRLGPIDWLVAAVIGLFALMEELRGSAGLPERPVVALWLGGAALTAILVLVRRRAPFAVVCLFTAANMAVFLLARQPPGAWQWYTQLLLLFTLLSLVPLGSWRGVAGLLMTGFFLTGLFVGTTTSGVEEYAVSAVMAMIAGGAGVAVRRHGLRADLADARSELMAARSELLAREAVARERARIARELHDIIAHSVSVMVLQAGGVRMMLPKDRRQEQEALVSIEETGRGAVEELHRMLGLLRAAPESDETAPRPTLDRLSELVAHLRSTGLDVALRVEGEPVPLAAGLDLSAYRIVQEALTNILKHAGPTEALIKVTYGTGELSLEITDEGPKDGRAGPAVPSGGNGLMGIRERVTLFHGDLDAGPREGGGYRVRAVLPLPASTSEAVGGR
ncbi:sensor histidine kinase [Nonomuraea basaltis]|uniref:sensor histidine kinase n=1 Tax=Nonomuraea basaltis TaxID=2495887 RepID=UPI00110C5011|nr:sensor histidine kinase [Nonomuraea basaltis]TMR98947.1 sensor histidine kinase [Nonomuraea basaltis]